MLEAILDELVSLEWEDIGEYGDGTVCTEGEDGEIEEVIAGVDEEVLVGLGDNLRDINEVTGGFFNSDNFGVFRELDDGIGFDIDACAGRDIVEDDGDIDLVGDCEEVMDESVLRRSVIIGRHNE